MNTIRVMLLSLLSIITSSNRHLLQIGLERVPGNIPYEEGAGLLGANGHGNGGIGPNGEPVRGRPPVAGYHGQDCTPDTGDYPDQCPLNTNAAIPHPILEPTNGIIGCVHNFDCCTCRQMLCAPNCHEVNCNGDSSCFGVKDILITGDVIGADLLCNGDLSCMGTKMVGTNVASIGCTGDGSCAYSNFDVTCLSEEGGCPLTCVGDNSCEAHPTDPRRSAQYTIRNAAGMICSHNSCRYATYNLLPNIGGAIICNGEMGCVGAIITTENVESIDCGGERGCQNAKILVTNPQNGFSLNCAGFNGCEGLKLEIIVTNPEITWFREISCSAQMSCKGMQVTIVKNIGNAIPTSTGSTDLVIEELGCTANAACQGAVFDFSSTVTFGSCTCNHVTTLACDGTMGIDTCLDKLECLGENSCEGMTKGIINPPDEFELICSGYESCKNFNLDIFIDGTAGTQRFNGITCNAARSCEGMEVNIINTGAIAINAGVLKCTRTNACLNAVYNTENAGFSTIECGARSTRSMNYGCKGCASITDGTCFQCGSTSPCIV